ncbi:MAG: OsmC family protein [Leptolyngbyaceae cyanobacterium SM2_3_12]|nr:OsmC family protein [Leptolyngbyaceae cyanobacterium SM2_3_12]
MTSVSLSSNGTPLGQTVAIRQFSLTADEPVALGGQDAGPAPFEWVLAGLGACKAMTVQMYATRKGWPLTNVSVNLSYEKRDDGHQIQADLALAGDLSPEQRQRLVQIADRCPVHKMLLSQVGIQTTLAPFPDPPGDKSVGHPPASREEE